MMEQSIEQGRLFDPLQQVLQTACCNIGSGTAGDPQGIGSGKVGAKVRACRHSRRNHTRLNRGRLRASRCSSLQCAGYGVGRFLT